MSSVSAPFDSTLPYLQWLLGHSGDVPAIVKAAEAVAAASGLPAHWDAVKALGDVLIPIAADFPTGAQMMSLSPEAEVHAKDGVAYQASVLGFDVSYLEALLPLIIQIVRLMRLIQAARGV